jgi:hypothetical protein
MAATAAKSKAKAPTVNELCRELLEIERDNPKIFRRIAEIKTLLKLQADAGGSFRETFPNLGWVSASPSKPARVTGSRPAIVIEAWSALKQPKQDKLIADGLVVIEAIGVGASYGQVRIELHAPPQGASK